MPIQPLQWLYETLMAHCIAQPCELRADNMTHLQNIAWERLREAGFSHRLSSFVDGGQILAGLPLRQLNGMLVGKLLRPEQKRFTSM